MTTINWYFIIYIAKAVALFLVGSGAFMAGAGIATFFFKK